MSKLLDEVYRIQSDNLQTPYRSQFPVRRVFASDEGEIVFNPNNEKYIYFSSNKKHHCYYIFNKVLKLVCEQIKKAKEDPQFRHLNLPEDFRSFTWYSAVNRKIIKDVKYLFCNYLPPQYVELVTLKYLNCFSHLFSKCSVEHNTSKNKIKNVPEITDLSIFGGAIGINDAWLDLLNVCTESSATAKISVNDILDFLLEYNYKTKVSKQSLNNILRDNEDLFRILDYITYTELKNPKFYSKNAKNDIAKYLMTIEHSEQFDRLDDSEINVSEMFQITRKQFKEYHDSTLKELGE